MIEHRTLGQTGLQVSVLGFGGSEIGYAPITPDELDRLLGNARDVGINVIDTAECYADSEEAIGQALSRSSRRDHFHLITKCGHSRGFDLPDWTPQLLEQSIDRSLQRLRTDHIDVLLLHSCSEDILRDEDVINVVQRARAAGKTRFIGYSGDSQPARVAVQSGLFDVLMTSLNIADQEAIDLTLPLTMERGMGVIVKRPLANMAWNSGATAEGERGRRYWTDGYTDVYTARLKRLDYDLLKGDVSHAVSLTLRFTLSMIGVTTAIVGTTNTERLAQNAELLQAGPLSAAQIAAIRARWQDVADASWTGQG